MASDNEARAAKRQKTDDGGSIPLSPLKIHDNNITALLQDITSLKAACSNRRRYLKNLVQHLPAESLRKSLEVAINHYATKTCKIAVIGETGTGKSALISTLLGQKELLPRGQMGDAVTACPIRICYDSSLTIKFRVQFMYTPLCEWRTVLERAKTLLNDSDLEVISQQQVVERVQVVYPDLTSARLKSMSIKDIINSNHSKQTLGTTKTFEDDDAQKVREILDEHVARNGQRNDGRWAIIEEAAVFINDVALECVEIVDLPGTGDENVARATKYEEHMRTSTALCVLAGSQRANNNSHYQNLVELAVRKFHYEGRLDRIILVCTHIDQFDPETMVAELKDPVITKLYKESKDMVVKLETARPQLVASEKRLLEAEEEIQACKAVLVTYNRKRAHVGRSIHPLKLPKCPLDSVYLENDKMSKTLDRQTFDYATGVYKKAVKDLTAELEGLNVEISKQRKRLQWLEESDEKLALHLSRALVHGRAKYIKERQKKIFGKLVRQFQMARQESGDGPSTEEAQFNTEELAVAEKIQIFCTSATAYLELAAIGDKSTAGKIIRTMDDTDMPALARSINKIALNLRRESLRGCRNKLDIALASLTEAASETPDFPRSGTDASSSLIAMFKVKLEALSAHVEECTKGIDRAIRRIHKAELSEHRATLQAQSFARAKGSEYLGRYKQVPVSGGLCWVEYKAACRHDGIWAVKRKLSINFNRDISLAIMAAAELKLKKLLLKCGSEKSQNAKFAIAQCYTRVFDIFGDIYTAFVDLVAALGMPQASMDRMDAQTR